MELSNICKIIRRRMKITQRELAMLIGTNQTEISFVERGFMPNDKNKAQKIVDIYNGLQQEFKAG